MKKLLLKSLIISSIITAVGTIINLVSVLVWDKLLLFVGMSGGEYQGYVGFGILLEFIYPMSGPGEVAGKVRHLSFDIVNFLIYFVMMFIIVFGFMYVIRLLKKAKEIKNKKEKKRNKKEK